MINSEPVVYSGMYTSYTRGQLIDLGQEKNEQKAF